MNIMRVSRQVLVVILCAFVFLATPVVSNAANSGAIARYFLGTGKNQCLQSKQYLPLGGVVWRYAKCAKMTGSLAAGATTGNVTATSGATTGNVSATTGATGVAVISGSNSVTGASGATGGTWISGATGVTGTSKSASVTASSKSAGFVSAGVVRVTP